MAVYDINRIFPAEVPQGYEDHVSDAHFVPAPCQVACPVGTDAPSYLAYIWENKPEEAFEAITATNPFSSICGRVCDAPCEPACRRASSDGPVQIRNLKRYVMDQLGASWKPAAVPVTRKETVGIVGSGPAGLTAAHDLACAGFRVHVYEMTDRMGGMMIWGIPAFRLPQNIIGEDIDRLMAKCPGIEVHLDTGLGRDISLEQLKERHDAVLLTIGSWWGKNMGIPGEDDERVVDGVAFLRRVNAGERPEMPETVVVVGGGDVAMDACRAALRLPGCKQVKVVYRRGPDEIPARRVELEGAIAEGIEFIYNTQQVAVETRGNGLALRCVQTAAGEPDADGRRRPVLVEGSEHDIECGLVIAAVGQYGACEDAATRALMGSDRVHTDWEGMRTADKQVFAAGDGAFGGSTIVMAMNHGQRAAYYVRSFLDGRDKPMPYRTPWRTRRVPVAQDLSWELNPVQHAKFHGVGEKPVEFPEIEDTYDWETARREAARCYRCDAETGSSDYAVKHREDIFSMARTNPVDHAKLRAMLHKRLRNRDNPFPENRPGQLDDVVILPANLSRLVIDPYREACKTSTDLGTGRIELETPFLVTGFDQAPDEVRDGVAAGLASAHCGYVGRRPPGAGVPWYQLLAEGDEASAEAAALLHLIGHRFRAPEPLRLSDSQATGVAVSNAALLAEAIPFALDKGFDMLLLDGSGALGAEWPELSGPPDLGLMREAIRVLRAIRKEEMIDVVWFGGIRSGTDAAKIIAMGAKAVVLGVPAGMAAGGEITAEQGIAFSADRSLDERAEGIANILKASSGEASMMARASGKTKLHSLEPEDLRCVTVATAGMTGLRLVGHQ